MPGPSAGPAAGASGHPHGLELPAHASAAALARGHVRKVLTEWGREDLTDSAELVISELVANAVKATPIDALADDGTTEIVWMHLYRSGAGVVLEVWDCSRTPPVKRSAGLDDECGRGLQIVDILAKEWGYRWPRIGGKIVWCTLI